MRAKIVYGSRGRETYFIENKEVSKEEFDSVITRKPLDRPPMQGNTPSCWPMKSDALAVHPEQIPEAMERNKRMGVTGVTYDPEDGRAILADRGARRDLMRVSKVHDNSGSYGDDHHIDTEKKQPTKIADFL